MECDEIVSGDSQSVQNEETVETMQLVDPEPPNQQPPALDIELRNVNLVCDESLALEKELFRENVPGLTDFEKERTKAPNRFRTELEPEDVRLVNELGQLSADQLMEYLRKIKDTACSLGYAQEEQSKRAKFLKIFQSNGADRP